MASNKLITKEQVLAAARLMVDRAATFWNLQEGTLTLEMFITKGVDPTTLHPTVFESAVEQLASGLAGLQQRARDEADPPLDPTEQELEDRVWGEYEARVAAASSPEELAAIVAEDEALLAEEGQAEREEISRRAERSFALREESRRDKVIPPVGYVQEDRLANLGEPDPPPMPGKTPHAIPEVTPEELYERWVREGRKVPRADEK